MQVIHIDPSVVVCIKPAGVISTDEPGGMPELVRDCLGDAGADVRTVHRLDRVVGGLMLLARSAESASALSREIREGGFYKEYLAVVHGETDEGGRMTDYLRRDKARKMTFVENAPSKDAREAVLDYKTEARIQGMSRVRIVLHTGRTHQIRCQFASRGFPLVGDRKYGTLTDGVCDIALWSCRLAFTHPATGERMDFTAPPPQVWPWTLF